MNMRGHDGIDIGRYDRGKYGKDGYISYICAWQLCSSPLHWPFEPVVGRPHYYGIRANVKGGITTIYLPHVFPKYLFINQPERAVWIARWLAGPIFEPRPADSWLDMVTIAPIKGCIKHNCNKKRRDKHGRRKRVKEKRGIISSIWRVGVFRSVCGTKIYSFPSGCIQRHCCCKDMMNPYPTWSAFVIPPVRHWRGGRPNFLSFPEGRVAADNVRVENKRQFWGEHGPIFSDKK